MTTEKNQKTLSIVYRSLKSLVIYAKNARTHSEDQIGKIVSSIKKFGWTNPILLDENGEVIAGHGRIMAAEKIGFDQVPTITLSGLTDAEKKAYRLADNKLPLHAGWDLDLLTMELDDLLSEGFDISLTGFDASEIDEMLVDSDTEIKAEDPYTTKIDTPVYVPSDVTPRVAELYDEEKTKRLVKNIKAANLPKEIRAFLMSAAERHTVFNFNKIADYYANAPEEIQALFEESALVIIDYGQAIENGFVHMAKNMVDAVFGEEGDENA